MSLIYSLIARAPDVVLCEHTEYSGNFMQIIRSILQKNIKTNSKCIISYDKYKIHYINTEGITYLCLSEELNDENAFAFLNDIKRKLLKTNQNETILSMNAFWLSNTFTDTLTQYMIYYNTHPLTTKGDEIITELNETKDAMIENIENLIDRENKMNMIVSKSENLNTFSMNISNVADSIRKSEEQKNNTKWFILLGVIILLIILYFVFK